jgi:hypothetical protein
MPKGMTRACDSAKLACNEPVTRLQDLSLTHMRLAGSNVRIAPGPRPVLGNRAWRVSSGGTTSVWSVRRKGCGAERSTRRSTLPGLFQKVMPDAGSKHVRWRDAVPVLSFWISGNLGTSNAQPLICLAGGQACLLNRPHIFKLK